MNRNFSRSRLRGLVGTLVIAACGMQLAAGPAHAKPPRPPRDAAAEARAGEELEALMRWLLAEGRDSQLVRLPFASVVFAATGHRILPVNKTDPAEAEVLAKLGRGLDEVLRRMNASDSPARGVKRINEASHHFEDMMREVFNALPGLRCDFARNTRGEVQRSGYPDLQVTDTASGRIYYVDPKLYEERSRRSSFRTFYFEPRRETNKVLADACHLVAGIAHNGERGERLRFRHWELIDCRELTVELKAEFHAGNQSLYREEAVLARGAAAPDKAEPPAEPAKPAGN